MIEHFKCNEHFYFIFFIFFKCNEYANFTNKVIMTDEVHFDLTDLTPPDFFLWGFLKCKVYKEHPTSIDELKTNITATIHSIDQETLLAVMNNMMIGCRECTNAKGAHLSDVIFKK